MAPNRPLSLSSVHHENISNSIRDHQGVRGTSPERAPVSPSESESSVDGLEEGFVKKPQANLQGLKAVVTGKLRRPRPTRTSSAFQRWRGQQRRPVPKLLLWAVTASITTLVLASLLVYYIIHLRGLIPPSDIEKTIALWGLSDYPTQFVATLPKDFSRDIIPIPCHSHNDYWRHVPLYDALAAGCTSVEVDVWLSGSDLFVGHSKKSLTKERTLESLYIDPLVLILTAQNAPNQITTTTNQSSTIPSPSASQLNGVFDTNPKNPLTLLIDMKTDGASTFPAVLSHLEPLRSRGWLTHFNGTVVVPGLITVVGTGNTPFDLLTANTTYRDIFFDAPLQDFWGDSGDDSNTTDTTSQTSAQPLTSDIYNPENSYYASVSFQKEIGKLSHGMVTPQQVLKIRGQIKGAEERGLNARYWDTPAWPVGRRDHVWDVLMREGVGSLNVDDLEAAKDRNWGG